MLPSKYSASGNPSASRNSRAKAPKVTGRSEMAKIATCPSPGTPTPLTVSARLYYQTSSREYIEFLRDQAEERDIPDENLMCTGEANRPAVVGPGNRTRGDYMFGLWSGPQFGDRIFAHSFDDTVFQQGYGRSPPEIMAIGTAFSP